MEAHELQNAPVLLVPLAAERLVLLVVLSCFLCGSSCLFLVCVFVFVLAPCVFVFVLSRLLPVLAISFDNSGCVCDQTALHRRYPFATRGCVCVQTALHLNS